MNDQIQAMPLQSIIMETSEDDLLAELNDNPCNPAAFGELYRKYMAPVYRYVYLRVGGRATDAEDLTSQVFLDALEGLPRYQHQGHFAAWLFTIARRKAADHYRHTGEELLLDDDSGPAYPDSDLLTQLIHQEELQDLARIPNPARPGTCPTCQAHNSKSPVFPSTCSA
jgi:RNA polymerase sigma-70 factor (ECF subfamily)